ncbi:DUF998 domain-containing protein [Microlunatus flavus]|uniref:DUF998 domain-containing protein n=1 Tax=Microlunatus flavus TaxID=1036181 RepID=A0A1H9JGL7_9ACTN|nr:DUF998 domain-containing protein [Microlunatus flavus]SEQ85929.1 Protein of unknown function [Microlunatus flavus]
MTRSALLVPVGSGLFTLAWLVLGAVSPGYTLFGHTIAPYSWVSQPISGLGLGVTGPWMNTAFVVSGVLVAVGVLSGARSWHGRLGRAACVLLALLGVGMVVCGLFTLESIMLHLLGFVIAVPLPALGLVLAGVHLRGSSTRLSAVGIVGGLVTLVLFVVFQATFDASGAGGNEGVSGLVQRALVLTVMAAVSVLVVAVSRPPAAAAGATTADRLSVG